MTKEVTLHRRAVVLGSVGALFAGVVLPGCATAAPPTGKAATSASSSGARTAR